MISVYNDNDARYHVSVEDMFGRNAWRYINQNVDDHVKKDSKVCMIQYMTMVMESFLCYHDKCLKI